MLSATLLDHGGRKAMAYFIPSNTQALSIQTHDIIEYYQGKRIIEDELNGACSTHGKMRKA
jgi:hypothetical protein